MRHLIFSFFLLVAFTGIGYGQLQTGADVAVTETTAGKVRGFIRNGIFTYKGIPYGIAKRFESAEPPEKWEGI